MSLSKLKDSIKAKTNIIDIEGNISENIIKLLDCNSKNNIFIDYKYRFFKFDKNKDVKHFWQNVHKDIKDCIKKELKLKDIAKIEYEFFHIKQKNGYDVYFFYINDKPCTEYNNFIAELTNNNIEPHKIFESLIGLLLKLEFIKKFQQTYEFQPEYYNAVLYLNTNKKGGIFDTLYPEVYFSEYKELVVSLHKKVFKEQKGDIKGNAIDLLFRSEKNSFRTIDDNLSATIFSKKPFIDFNNYNKSINHTQNLLLDTLQQLLKKYDINFKCRYFKANYFLNDFLEVKDKIISKKVIIIDNLTNTADNLKQQLYDRLQQEYPNSVITSATEYSEFDALDNKNNYLILNSTSKNNGSSVIVDGKNKNTFWDAYKARVNNKHADLDYYSKLKYSQSQSDRLIVLQGLNIINIKKDKLDNKLKKIQTEIWLKEQVFHAKKLQNINLDDNKLTLIYIRKLKKDKKYGKDSFYSVIIDVTIKNEKIMIENFNFVYSERELKNSFSYLSKREKLYNDSFFIIDKTAEVMLMSYNSSRIPRIIGNSTVDSIELAADEDSDNKLSRQATKPKEIVLPYYIAKTKERHIYLEQSNNDLLYFVTPSTQPNSTIAKQNLIYNILTFDKNGDLLKALDQSVTELFLKSFTEDIIKNNEYSKSSILEKIAKLYIEN
jgi:hypothetical protein